ncbi:uncharacterized protein Tco025E_00250 [Trypanosoma conorhini]|uniref:Uncharacterized protein n=1 Tax=Trypanosoma conorhini TaxID=83891 RepID=A0A422QBZ9_9TRYP|nr:uncharacterized protein Tco025E_00250 [Trypanosoma conorhini]RNF27513.1 hypothetical protein Tco025E_00250 [Trypanosoma conorhini]
MTAQQDAAGSDTIALVRAAEERIPCEICCHFTGMASYRKLRDGDGGRLASVSRQGKRFRDPTREREVRIKSCTCRVLSCMACQVLKGYCVIWAESLLDVATYDPFASHEAGRRRVHEKSNATATTTTAKGVCEYHQLTLRTLHIVDQAAYKQPVRHSFALQSVCQPGRVLQLECYPRHMVHFGLLMYALWQSPDEVFRTRGGEPRLPRKTTTSEVMSTGTENTTAMPSLSSSSQFPFLTSAEHASVLILGLGGNVIGNCLDAALPVDVPIDVVEVEPAVLETCQRQGQVPPWAEVEAETTAESARVWVASRGKQRHPNYRFIVGDAREVLRGGNPKTAEGKSPLHQRRYGLVFLDCYDPEKERMMHDVSLIDVCRSRLRPGGALIVNAHILPLQGTLEEQFLARGFDSVQALRVAGCDQSIVVCLAKDKAAAGGGAENVNNGGGSQQQRLPLTRLERFCVRHARQLAWYIQNPYRADLGVRRLFRGDFCLDANWLKSSRSVEGASCRTRVWEHYD